MRGRVAVSLKNFKRATKRPIVQDVETRQVRLWSMFEEYGMHWSSCGVAIVFALGKH